MNQKSKAHKEAAGTVRPHREKSGINLDLQPLKELPEPPKEFNADERWFYQTVTEALFNSGLLRSADLMTIESMAGWWSILKESQKDIRKNGMVQQAKSGWSNVSPMVAIFEKAWNKLKEFSDRYGFNLISKDKISAPAARDEKSELIKRLQK